MPLPKDIKDTLKELYEKHYGKDESEPVFFQKKRKRKKKLSK